MLGSLKRLFARPAATPSAWDPAVVWAESNRYVFRALHEDEGFLVEGHTGALPWRLEWGPSQRPYVHGSELRLRAELGASNDTQALVLDRALQAEMERSVFEQYVEGVQTRIDNETPPEMRWIVLYPKLVGAELGSLRDRFEAIGASKPWLMAWLDGTLSTALLEAPLANSQRLALVVARGRLTLRVGLPVVTAEALDQWSRVFQVALREARRATDEVADADLASTQPALWTASRGPDEPPTQP